MAERTCPACGREQPETAEGEECLYCGADLGQPEPPPVTPPEPSAAPPPVAAPPPAPEQPTAEEPVPEGKRKCPSCGEILYDTETRCWRCGHEIAPPSAAVAAIPPAAAPPPPPEPPDIASTPPPVVAPPEAVPPVVEPTPPPPPVAPAPAPPYVPAGGAPAALAPDAAAQNLGVWALVVGLLSCFCCPIIGSIIAIYLGVQAKNRGVAGLGTAGIVLGILSLIGGLILVALSVIGLIAESH